MTGVLMILVRQRKNFYKMPSKALVRQCRPENLKSVGKTMSARKSRSGSPFWVVGQVAALFPQYRANDETGVSVVSLGDVDYYKGKASSREKIYDGLLCEHYGYLQTYSPHESAPFFTLEQKRGSLYVAPWNSGKSESSGKLECTYSSDETVEFPSIEFIEEELSAKAAYATEARQNQSFEGQSILPSFQSDELSHICLFAHAPFSRYTEASTDKFKDITSLSRKAYDTGRVFFISFTTRAAVTVFYRVNPNNQGSRQYLKDVSLASIVVATHESLSGTKFSEYLPLLIAEFSMRKYQFPFQLEESGIEQLGEIGNFIIPFIPVIGEKASLEFMNLPGVNCGFISAVDEDNGVNGFGYANCLSDIRASGYSKETAVLITKEDHYEKITKEILREACENAENQRKGLRTVQGRPIRVHFHFVIVGQLNHRIDWTKYPDSIFKNESSEQSFYNDESGGFPAARRSATESPFEDHLAEAGRRSLTVIVCREIKNLKLQFDVYADKQDKRDTTADASLFCIVIIPVETLYPNHGQLGFTGVEKVVLEKCCSCTVANCNDKRCGCVRRGAPCSGSCHEKCHNKDDPSTCRSSKLRKR